jgi:hypothetical protein
MLLLNSCESDHAGMTKTFLFLISLVALCGCQPISAEKAKVVPTDSDQAKATAARVAAYKSATKLAELKDSAVKESSGIVASRTTPGTYWTHNDSGDGPYIYAFDGGGQRRGVWRVTNAQARDWEDIAAGPGPQSGQTYLYIGDIGNNGGNRSEVIVYRVPEPQVTSADATSTKSQPRLTEPAEAIRLRYPRYKPDAETLLVHPETGTIYIVTKEPFGNPEVYQAVPPFNMETTATTLVRIGELDVPSLFGSLITGGDISPDGHRVALCDYTQAYELVLPAGVADFNTIWKQPVAQIDMGNRKQGEAIAYRLDGMALLATSEGSPMPLIEAVRR